MPFSAVVMAGIFTDVVYSRVDPGDPEQAGEEQIAVPFSVKIHRGFVEEVRPIAMIASWNHPREDIVDLLLCKRVCSSILWKCLGHGNCRLMRNPARQSNQLLAQADFLYVA